MQHSEPDQEKQLTAKTGFSPAKLSFPQETATKEYFVRNTLFKSPIVKSALWHVFTLVFMVVAKFHLVYLEPHMFSALVESSYSLYTQ